MDRRYVLSLIGSSSVLVLAGCMSGEEGSDESGDSESGEDDDSGGGSKESDSGNDTEDDGERESEDDDAEGETDGSTDAENGNDDDSGDGGTEEDVNSYPYLSVEDTTISNDDKASFTVEVLQQFSDEAPAEVDIVLTNDSSSDQTFQFASMQPFDSPWGEHTESDATIVVVPGEDTPTPPTEDHIPNEPTNESCWQAIRPVVVEEELVSIDTAPGESIGGTHLVLADHESEECLETGTYQFSTTVRTDSEDLSLSFSLLLDNARSEEIEGDENPSTGNISKSTENSECSFRVAIIQEVPDGVTVEDANEQLLEFDVIRYAFEHATDPEADYNTVTGRSGDYETFNVFAESDQAFEEVQTALDDLETNRDDDYLSGVYLESDGTVIAITAQCPT